MERYRQIYYTEFSGRLCVPLLSARSAKSKVINVLLLYIFHPLAYLRESKHAAVILAYLYSAHYIWWR